MRPSTLSLLLPLAVVVTVAVAQTPPDEDEGTWDFRIVDADGEEHTSGRLEASRNEGPWGTVCSTEWSDANTMVACTSAGFTGVVATQWFRTLNSTLGRNEDQTIGMAHVECVGNESNLEECRFEVVPDPEDCPPNEDIGVRCLFVPPPSPSPPTTTTAATTTTTTTTTTSEAPQPTTTPASTNAWSFRLVAHGGSTEGVSSGRLEARKNTGSWGTVCDDGWKKTNAIIACQSMGFTNNSVASWRMASSNSNEGSDTQPIVMDDVSCTGTETSLSDCSFVEVHNCGHSEDVALTCGHVSTDSTPAPSSSSSSSSNSSSSTTTNTTVAPSSTSSTWGFRLIGLDNSTNVTSGRLEVRPPLLKLWGTVCDDGFTVVQARIACTSVGLATQDPTFLAADATRFEGNDAQPIHMDDVSCTGSESDLSHCSFIGNADTDCGHTEDVILTCETVATTTAAPEATIDAATVSSGWQYRLLTESGQSVNNTGRLEVRETTSDAFGVVCATGGFDLTAAKIACRSLGYDPVLVLADYTSVSSSLIDSSKSVRMHFVSCSGSEESLDRCSFADTSTTCTFASAAELTCTSLVQTTTTTTTPAPTSPTTTDSNGATAPPATPAPVSTGIWQLELEAGSTGSYQRLLVKRNSVSENYELVCSANFDAFAAEAACRALGFDMELTTGTYITIASAEGLPTLRSDVLTDSFVGNMACVGSESRFDRCPITPNTCADVSQGIALRCAVSSFEYRLASYNSSTTSGRLEVRATVNSLWSTICSRSFDARDLKVACASLGLTYNSRTSTFRNVTSFEQPTSAFTTIQFGGIQCTGSETRLEACTRDSSVLSQCTHDEDVYIECGDPTAAWEWRLVGTDGVSGRLETRPNTSVPFGTVCGLNFGEADSTVACRALGFDTSNIDVSSQLAVLTTTGIGTESQPVWIDGPLSCSGSEKRPELCNRISTSSCSSHDRDVFLTCKPAIPSGLWGYSLSENPDTGAYQSSGRLHVQPNSSATWGTVCDDRFEAFSAKVACRSIVGADAMATTAARYRTAVGGETAGSFVNSSGFVIEKPIWMNNIRCTGREARLDKCPLETSVTTCLHTEDIYLDCDTVAPANNPSQFDYKLVDIERPGRGRLEVRPNNDTDWGTVCFHEFDEVDAIVACKSLGITTSVAKVYSLEHVPEEPIWMGNVRCAVSDASLAACRFFEPPAKDHCGVAKSRAGQPTLIVGVDCTQGAYEWRLLPQGTAADAHAGRVPGATEGELQARSSSTGTWSQVCYSAFTQASAVAACRTIAGAGMATAGFFPIQSPAVQQPLVTRLTCQNGGNDLLDNGACDWTFAGDATESCTGVYITCNTTVTVTTSNINSIGLSLMIGDLGVVFVQPPAQGKLQHPRGVLCDPAGVANTVLGGLICRQAGFSTVATAAVRQEVRSNPFAAREDGPIYAGSVQCTSTASSLSDCSFETAPDCTHDDILYVDCTAASYQYRLTGSPTARAGRLEMVNTDNVSGTVCNLRGFNDKALRVACASAGFGSGAVAIELPPTSIPIASEDVEIFEQRHLNCSGAESGIALCGTAFGTDLTNGECTHDQDVLVSCGSSTGGSGCEGHTGCSSWALLTIGKKPIGCNPIKTVRVNNSSPTVSHGDCRVEALQQNVPSGSAAMYFMATDETYCDIYVCDTSSLGALEYNATYVNDVSAPRMYAPLSSVATTLGVCDASTSCNGNGVAVSSAATASVTCTLDSSDSSCVSTVSSSAGQGVRLRTSATCACTCNEGWVGPSCNTPTTMSSVPSDIDFTYTHPSAPLTQAELGLIATGIATLYGDATMTFQVFERVLDNDFKYYSARISVSSGAGLSKETTAMRQLVSPTYYKQVENLIESTKTGLELLDLSIPLFALAYIAEDVVAVSYSNQSVTDATYTFSSFSTLTDAANDQRFQPVSTSATVRSMTVLVSGSRVTGKPQAILSVDGRGTLATCELTYAKDVTDGCASFAECELYLPELALDVQPKIQIVGAGVGCQTTTRRQSTAYTMNVTIRSNVLDRMPTVSIPAGTIVKPNTVATSDAAYLSIILIAIIVTLGIAVVATLRAIVSGHRLLPLMILAVSVGGGVFYITETALSISELATKDEALVDAIFNEYRSEACASSNLTSVPHRYSWVPADGACHQMTAYGERESTYFAAVYCAPVGDTGYDPTRISVATGSSLAECESMWAAGPTTFKATDCIDERELMPAKGELSQQFVHLFCVLPDQRQNLVSLVETTLDPSRDPGKPLASKSLAFTDYMLQSVDTSSLFFFIGKWRSRASRFFFRAIRTSSSVALATFSEEDLLAGRVGSDSEMVIASDSGTPPALSRDDGSTRTLDQSAPVGALFSSGDSTIDLDAFGQNAMRFHGIKGSYFDLGTLSSSSGFTITFWMKANVDATGFVFLAVDGWLNAAGHTPIAQRMITVLDNPLREFFATDWAAYSSIFVDGSRKELRFSYRLPLDRGGNNDDLRWSSDVLGDVFDGQWHFIALGFSEISDRGRVQIFVDGATSYRESRYQQCLASGSTFPSVQSLSSETAVGNQAFEETHQDGVAYVGYLNAGVYGFIVHDRILDQHVIVNLGTDAMKTTHGVDVDNSRLASYILYGIFGLVLIISILQACFAPDPPTITLEDDDPLTNGTASKSAAATGGATKSGKNGDEEEDDGSGRKIVVTSATTAQSSATAALGVTADRTQQSQQGTGGDSTFENAALGVDAAINVDGGDEAATETLNAAAGGTAGGGPTDTGVGGQPTATAGVASDRAPGHADGLVDRLAGNDTVAGAADASGTVAMNEPSRTGNTGNAGTTTHGQGDLGNPAAKAGAATSKGASGGSTSAGGGASKGGSGGSGATTTATSSSAVNSSATRITMPSLGFGKAMAVIVPMFMSVAQNMALYMGSWSWPVDFTDIFDYVYMPLSFDFFVFPSIPLYVNYVVQFSIGVGALVFLVVLARNDHEVFKEKVLEPVEMFGLTRASVNRDMLPIPDTTDPIARVSTLEYTISDRTVVGTNSRAALQNAITDAMLNPDQPAPEYDLESFDANAGKFIAVVVSSEKSKDPPKRFDPSAKKPVADDDHVPKFAETLARLPASIEYKLEVSSVDIATRVPTPQRSLLHIYRALEDKYPQLAIMGLAARTPAGFFSIIQDVRAHAALAGTLSRTGMAILSKALTSWRAKKIAAVRARIIQRGGKHDVVTRRMELLDTMAESFDFVADFFARMPEDIPQLAALRGVTFRKRGSGTASDSATAAVQEDDHHDEDDENDDGDAAAQPVGSMHIVDVNVDELEDVQVVDEDTEQNTASANRRVTFATTTNDTVVEVDSPGAPPRKPSSGSAGEKRTVFTYRQRDLRESLTRAEGEAIDTVLAGPWVAETEVALANVKDGKTVFGTAKAVHVHVVSGSDVRKLYRGDADDASTLSAQDQRHLELFGIDCAVAGRCVESRSQKLGALTLYGLLNLTRTGTFCETLHEEQIERAKEASSDEADKKKAADIEDDEEAWVREHLSRPLNDHATHAVGEVARKALKHALQAVNEPLRKSERFLGSADVDVGFVRLGEPQNAKQAKTFKETTGVNDVTLIPQFHAIDLEQVRRAEGVLSFQRRKSFGTLRDKEAQELAEAMQQLEERKEEEGEASGDTTPHNEPFGATVSTVRGGGGVASDPTMVSTISLGDDSERTFAAMTSLEGASIRNIETGSTTIVPSVVETQMIVPQPQLPKCPAHERFLFPAAEDVHLPVRTRNPDAYECAHRSNVVHKQFCLPAAKRDKQCDVDFFVCPIRTCNFAVCATCQKLTLRQTIRAQINGALYSMQSASYLSFIGLIVIVIAQSIYLPAVKNAVATVLCHQSLVCHYPSCYSPATPEFLAMSFASAFVIFTLGIGLVYFLFMSLVRRKRAIMHSSALAGSLTRPDGLCGEKEHFFGSTGVFDTFVVGADDTSFATLLIRDFSMFKGLYEQYEFRWMYVHPMTFVFKVAVLLVVLYSGEPNSLRLILYSALVEVVQLVYYVLTSPFIDMWLDLLAKAGSLHQVLQLALMCEYRAATFEDPTDSNVVPAMIFASCLYIVFVIAVIVKVAVVPLLAAVAAKKERQEQERARYEKMRKERDAEEQSRLATSGGSSAAGLSTSAVAAGEALRIDTPATATFTRHIGDVSVTVNAGHSLQDTVYVRTSKTSRVAGGFGGFSGPNAAVDGSRERAIDMLDNGVDGENENGAAAAADLDAEPSVLVAEASVAAV